MKTIKIPGTWYTFRIIIADSKARPPVHDELPGTYLCLYDHIYGKKKQLAVKSRIWSKLILSVQGV